MTKLLAASFLTLAMLLGACQQDPQSSMTNPVFPQASRTTAANPKIVYVSSDGHLAVMDSDGTHQTVINTSDVNRNGNNLRPMWSTGSSVSYATNILSNDTVYSSIRAIDVSVNSSGTAIGSNIRSLAAYSYVQSDASKQGASCWSPSWSSTSSVNQIAYSVVARNGSAKYLCRVSASTGIVDTLWSTTDQIRSNPTWNSDDSRIAVSCYNGTRGYIIVLNTSTKAVTDSIYLGSHSPSYIEWSRAAGSVNKLAIIDGGDYHLYYLTPSNGSSLESTGIATYGATWSPSNSTVMYNYTRTSGGSRNYTYPLVTVRPSSTTTTTVVSDFGYRIEQLNWHR
jgi:hypothetical protein